MTDVAARTAKPKAVYRNIPVTQIVGYRLPPSGMVSILHRISGAVLFLLLPFVVWLFDVSLSTELSYERFTSAFVRGIGVLPGFLMKLVALGLSWAYLFHFIAGLRHLWMDLSHAAVTRAAGRLSALVTLGLSTLLTLALAVKLFF